MMGVFWTGAWLLIQALGLVFAIGFIIFSMLGPVIEVILDILLPPDQWNDDDENAA